MGERVRGEWGKRCRLGARVPQGREGAAGGSGREGVAREVRECRAVLGRWLG